MDYEKLYWEERLAHMKTLKDASGYLSKVAELQSQLADLFGREAHDKLQSFVELKEDN